MREIWVAIREERLRNAVLQHKCGVPAALHRNIRVTFQCGILTVHLSDLKCSITLNNKYNTSNITFSVHKEIRHLIKALHALTA